MFISRDGIKQQRFFPGISLRFYTLIKIMEVGKHEKYVLLNEDSDVEEFDKSKVALMHHPQDGKTHLKSSKEFPARFHPQRLCHVFFIVLLLTSQVFLSLFVLKLHQELETVKQKQVTTQKDAEQKDVETNIRGESNQKDVSQKVDELKPSPSTPKAKDPKSDVSIEDSASLRQRVDVLEVAMKSMIVSPKPEEMKLMLAQHNSENSSEEEIQGTYLLECVRKLNMSREMEFQEMKGRITQLQNHMLNFTGQFLNMEGRDDSLMHSLNSQNLFESKMNVMEKQFNNATEALNSLQNRLEEGLDSVFLQISQLKDDFYFIENFLNHTDIGSSKSYVSTSELLKETEDTPSTLSPSSQNYAPVKDPTHLSLLDHQTQAMEPETVEEKHKINIPFIKKLTDLQVFFYGTDKNANGYLTFTEIEKVLGEDAPQKEELEEFDDDNNKMYSYLELRKALELTE
ncbi:EF-hand calcium binding domain 14 [Chelydra serpentina]|uniref:EF-hand calcium binding domain 14 n=1 Tax=Chelydra serpentina TaxID=8475 RepID=A0A8T1SZC3_CHESE|nr:EF-hand calcium binding domain 14 [Chelydra serpentina]